MEYPKGTIKEEKEPNMSEIRRKDMIKLERTCGDNEWSKSDKGDILMAVRNDGIFGKHSFYLTDEFNWKILKDDFDMLVLVPTRKR